MTVHPTVVTTVVACFLLLSTLIPVNAKDKALQLATFKPKLSTFDAALERAGVIASNNDWKDEDWSDEDLQKSLDAIITRVRKLTKNDLLKLPVGFDLVRPRDLQNRLNQVRGENSLFVGKKVNLARARESNILADESVRISFANNCVIVCRGVVEISHGSGNVVLAGHYIRVGFDAIHQATDRGSLLISAGVVAVSHAKNTVMAAPRAVELSHGTNVQFINSPNCSVPTGNHFPKLKDDTNTLPKQSQKHRLIETLKITEIVQQQTPNGSPFVVIETPIGEMVARAGDPIPNPGAFRPEQIQGWKLVYVRRRFAFFSNGKEYASAYIPRNR